MATITASGAGNVLTGANWTGGVAPGNGDIADLAALAMTLAAGATFPASGTLLGIQASGIGKLTCALTTGNTTTINATTITAGTCTAGFIIASGSAGTLNVNATTITGGSAGGGAAVRHNGTTTSCIVNVTATNCNPGSNATAYGINNTTTGTLNYTGNATGNGTTTALYNTSTGSFTVNGKVTGGSAAARYGLQNASTGAVVINNGTNDACVGGSSATAHGFANISTGSVTITGNLLGVTGAGVNLAGIASSCVITGNVTGGSGSASYGLYNSTTSAVTIVGNVIGGSDVGGRAMGVYNTGGAITLTGNIQFTATTPPWSGTPPTYTPQSINYVQIGSLQFCMSPGSASANVVLSKETGANARGGSGTCAKLVPSSTTLYGYWYFYVSVTAATPFVLSFYHKIDSGFNGLIKVSIYDTDKVTLKNTSESVTLTDDGAYHQFSATSVNPTATGFCLVQVEIKQGAHGIGDAVYIDDVTIA